MDLKRERFLNRMTDVIFEEHFMKQSNKYIKGKLIDIGCGIKPHKNKLAHLVSEHIGVDHEFTSHNKSEIDLFGTAYEIPVSSETFDSAICTVVLEHLEEPESAIRECFRVLKPGGHAIYAVPLLWHLHEEPRDFYRFTKYGLKYLFEKAGFEIVEIKPLSGFLVTFLQLHLYIVEGKFNKGIIRKTKIIDGYIWLCNKIGISFNKKDNSLGWTWMYVVTAKRPN